MIARSSISLFFFTAVSFDSTLKIFYLRRMQKEILSLFREIKDMLGSQLMSSARSAESKVLSISLSYSAHQSPSKHLRSELLSIIFLRYELLRGSVALSPAMDFMKVLDQTVREMYNLHLELDSLFLVQQIWIYVKKNLLFSTFKSILVLFFKKREVNLKVLKVPKIEQKALAVIEYLIAKGPELVVDDNMEHSHQIMSLSGFEYVEPNGKDLGINVRRKVETILALIGDKEKIQAMRNKASTALDKYFGLSSTGITYKSSSASYGTISAQGRVTSSEIATKIENKVI